MIIYFSGDNETSGESIAEDLCDGLGIMLTYACHDQKKKRENWRIVRMAERTVGVESHFLDSGAFTLWGAAMKWAKETGRSRWEFYNTDEHWEYLARYAKFVKKYAAGIDHYANVDVIQNAELTYRNQKFLEKEYGLHPVPVVHLAPHSERWLKKYMDEGYDFIGLGGLAGKASRRSRVEWLNKCFDLVCNGPDRLPRVKLHGFGITSYPLLLKYPWWSVDSVTWAKAGGFGRILVPHKRKGRFVFDETPYLIATSMECSLRKEIDGHYLTLSEAARKIVKEWLDKIGVPLGKIGKDEEVLEFGVLTRHTERRAANLMFFEALRKSLPEWPWPYRPSGQRSFGL